MFPSPWNPEEQQRKSTITARSLDEFFVVSDYEQASDGQVAFRGHGVYSFDPEAEVFRMHWFDSMGGAGSIADGRMEGDVLTFQKTSSMGQHRYRYTFDPGGGYVFEMAMSHDGENWLPQMEGHYRKA